MRPILAATAALMLAFLLTLVTAHPAAAAGVVTDCTTFGPGPGTLAAAVATDGLVTFACSGTIVLDAEIPVPTRELILDGSGQRVVLSGDHATRLFNVGLGLSLQLHKLTLTAGSGGSQGGGAILSGGYLTITNSALLSNTAAYGGALELFNGSALIQNSVLAGNQALADDQGGGAIDQYYSQIGEPGFSPIPEVRIQFSTITGNRAAVAARAGVWQENGKLLLEHSILSDNNGSSCAVEPLARNAGAFISTGNLADDGTCLPKLQADPRLGALGNDGASTPVYPLLPGSPAIDAGPADLCPGAAVDQRNLLRPRDGSGDGVAACDLGAYEYAGRFMVSAASAGSPAAYWTFDEGTGGTAMDGGGSGLTAALQPGAAFAPSDAPLLFSSPYALASKPGAGAQVADAPALHPADGLTVAAWVRLAQSGDLQPVVSKLVGESGPGYALRVREGVFSAEVWDSTNQRHVITGEVTAGSWLHLALTYQPGGQMAAYVNGRSVGAQPLPPAAAPSAGSAPLTMQADGAIDDVRIYHKALSPGAVAVLAGGRSCVTNGTTWAGALPDLQCALSEARAGDEVWVAPGVYRPTHGPTRSATFAIGDGVGVYGGFRGDESSREQRTPDTARPVLSGDVEANDQVDAGGVLTAAAGLVGRNALHVVSIRSALTTTVLEGFIVSGGQANGAPDAQTGGCADNCGGGIFISGGAPQLRNLSLIGNQASGSGGGIFAAQSSTLVISATLQANAAGSGGGLALLGATPAVFNSLISGNFAGEGGGVYARDSSVHMVNVTVAANRAAGQGGGLLLEGGGASLNNMLIGGNQVGDDGGTSGGAGAQIAGSATLHNSLVQGGCPPGPVCGDDVQTADPLLAALPDAAGAPTAAGDFHLQPTSPAIDSGDNSTGLVPSLPAGATVAAIGADLGGDPRITAVRVLPPRIDLGAYEAPNAPPVFTTTPVVTGATNVKYVYTITAIDPNELQTKLEIEVSEKPQWLDFAMQPNGDGLLQGTPASQWYGLFPITLRAVDTLGAGVEQSYVLQIVYKPLSLFMPSIIR